MKFVIFACILHAAVAEDCPFPNDLSGIWTSTNFGSITISNSTPHFTMETTFTGSSSTNTTFDCLLISATTYILKSVQTLSVFSGTTNVYIYMCFDLHVVNTNAAYYYLNTATEVGLSGLRLAGISETISVTSATQVCTEMLDTAEYNTMVRTGSENTAVDAEYCMTILMGTFRYTYQDSTGTYCANVNTSTINACDSQNLTTLLVNNTGCTEKSPFFSSGGLLGCLFTISTTATSTYYTTVYNLDTTVDSSSTYRFTCATVTTDNNGTIYMSLKPTECASGQTSTVLPSGGALMVLTTESVPTSSTSSTTNWTWLIILCVLLGVFIIVVIIILCLYLRYRKRQKEKAREKKTLITDEHPLGEMSMSIDAPASMEHVADGPIAESRSSNFRTPRSKRKDALANPMGETSMNLDFKGRSWDSFGTATLSDMDPFTEMDNGMVVPITPQGSKAARSMKNSKQKSFIFSNGAPKANGHTRNILPITDGKTEVAIPEYGDMTARSVKAPSLKSYSVKAPSISARSIKAPSVKSAAPSVKSFKAGSVKSFKSNVPSERGIRKVPSKLTRSATSTRIGSVTTRGTRSRGGRRKLSRSKTMVFPDKGEDGVANQEMNEFMKGEMTTFDDTMSEAAKSKKAPSVKSKSTSKTTTPRRSILKKKSAYMSSKEFLTEAELEMQMLSEVNASPEDTASEFPSMKRRDSYLSVKQKTDFTLSSSLKKPTAGKGPWK